MNASQEELRDIFEATRKCYLSWLENTRRTNELLLRAWSKGCLHQIWSELQADFEDHELCLQYFIRQRGTGDIKLGRTSNIERRFSGLLTGSSRGIDLIACYPAEPGHELELKREFESCNIRGEWFYPRRELLDYLRLIGVDPETFTDKPFPPFTRGRGFKSEWLS